MSLVCVEQAVMGHMNLNTAKGSVPHTPSQVQVVAEASAG